MQPHSLEVLDTWQPTPTTRAIRVSRPPGFAFQTSQAVRLVLATRDGTAMRPMSIASGHARPYLEFAARSSDSAFKRAFFALGPGDRVGVVGPGGQFFLARDRPVVLIAGGVGITPFRSMLQTVADEGGPRTPILLLYANRSMAEVAFRAELDELQAKTFGIQIRYTTGAIDRELLRGVVADHADAIYYIAGPGGFVRAVGAELLALGVQQSAVRMEMFRGYTDEDSAGRPPGPPSWDATYRTQPTEQLPWFYADLDPDLARALADHDVRGGSFLDVGTGPGTQAIRLAERGFVVTATDISPAAIAIATERARAAGVAIDLRVEDALAAGEPVDHVFDRGCFHVIPTEHQRDYVSAMHARLRPGGLVFLKCFSDEEPGAPHPFTPDAIRALFEPQFTVLSVERTEIQGTLASSPRALFCVLRRTP